MVQSRDNMRSYSKKNAPVFILSAPAGTGKTTLVKRLLEEFPHLSRSISCTTRPPRPGELHGKDYFFLTFEEFKKKQERGDFLEYAHHFGYDYGTLKETIIQEQGLGRPVILIIDTCGVKTLRDALFPGVFIFMLPPSMGELHKRLLERNTEEREGREKRLIKAQEEMQQIFMYDYCFVNESLEDAYHILRSIFIAEMHRVH